MSTPARSADNRSQDPVGNAPHGPSPACIGKRSIVAARTAASTAFGILHVVAEMAENVPYIGAVSKALTTFTEVLNEVEFCKRDCRAAMSEATEFVELMKDFEAKAHLSTGGKESELRKAFIELCSALFKCVDTLQALGVDSKRVRDRVKLLLKRGDVQLSVREWRDKMRVAKEKFNMEVAFETHNMVHVLHQHYKPYIAFQRVTSGARPIWRLRAAPPIFYGREIEVEHTVDLIVHQAPARVAILGSGGIGKTCIALSVLHHPAVEALYGNQRCFVSCEAITSCDDVVRDLAEALGLHIERVASAESARHHLLSSLESITGIVCLDNLETPWDADTAAIEGLLTEMGSLTSFALIITSRVTDTPLIEWSSPPLNLIKPFSFEAALQTWDYICADHDEYAVHLIEAVERVPLAVTLLARLARAETAKVISDRWGTEHTKLIRSNGSVHRLNNFALSIDLSLRALNSREAIDVLSIICIFPNGFYDFHLHPLDDAFKDRLSFRRAITLLKQFSLVDTENFGSEYSHTHVLSPIRHHIQQYNHVSDELFLMLIDVMMQDPQDWFWYPVLTLGLSRLGLCRERCLEVVISNPILTRDIEVLSQALEEARKLDPQNQSRLHRRLARVLRQDHRYDAARKSLRAAIKLDEQWKDRRALFLDWTEWLSSFKDELCGREDECQCLDEVQDAIRRSWALGHDEGGVWDRGLSGHQDLAEAQHFVNEGRRKLRMTDIHRSDIYSDEYSTVQVVEHKTAYD